MIVCTSACNNYLPKVMALADSLKETNPDVKFLALMVEDEIHPIIERYGNLDYAVLARELDFLDFKQFIFKHDIVEASTAVKGKLFKYCLNNFPDEDKFVYLDPDILVFSSLIELNQALDIYNIVVTPHLLIPGNIDMEISSLQHGVYNLGFLAIKRSPEAESFINWWTERLDRYCYDDIANGLFTDQKWIDLAPCFFNVHVLKHHGYNVATWSLKTTEITIDNDNYFVDGVPLRFFHFSGFDSGIFEHMLGIWVSDSKSPFYKLEKLYNEKLMRFRYHEMDNIQWSYDYFISGEKICKKTRILFRNISHDGRIKNPFELSNKFIVSVGEYNNRINYLQKLLKRILFAISNPKRLIKKVEQYINIILKEMK